MTKRAFAYLIVVTTLAALSGGVLYYVDPAIPAGALVPVIVLCSLALVAEGLSVLHAKSVTGSVGFVPYLASVLIVPHWTALVGATLVRLIVEITSRRETSKAAFNTTQQALTFSSSVIVYRLAGGESMTAFAGVSLVDVTLAIGLPALASFVVSFVVNSTLVAGFIAAKSDRSVGEILQGAHTFTIGVDMLASPVVFLFAWAYVSWGPYGAVALWIPVLGLRQLQKTNLELDRTNSELLELMVKSMEARDPYTSGHSRRVQQFSVAIARGLELSPSDIDLVGKAALLHDVGKIYDKYAPILRKPGKLSADEWQTMQAHPSDGAALVGTVSSLHDIVPAIRHHHERWDGTGYPEGLAGDTIPRISRIIAFADTIDAMISERPYRRTMTETDVRSEIVRCRGTQFDPTITDKILSAQVWRLIFPPSTGVEPSSLTLLPNTDRAVKRA